MIKIDTVVWLVVVAMVMAMAIAQGAPTVAKTNSTALENSRGDQVQLLDTTNSNASLKERLRQLYESQVSNTTAFTSYSLILTHQWQVWKLDHCQAKIKAPSAIGTALYCDRSSSTACQLSVRYINTQTLSTQDGVSAEFSVSMSVGEPGIIEAKMSMSVSTSHTVTHTYSDGKEFLYTFPVGVGKMCTPSIVSYYLQCHGTHWSVNDDAWSKECGDVQARYGIDFADPHRWFVDPKNGDWYQYVYEDKEHGDMLWSFHVRYKAPPKSCEDIVQIVDLRTLADRRNQTSTEAFLGFDNGQSISVVSCVYTGSNPSVE
ncbi:hypothetical protein BGZ70_000530 [Mortierella alpina]|uniref:Uncharacterized protein n=1 Tax=Mortierella alpina TaxID=64518 RepID=A0A9P6LXW3_MORAP|nr:hypothetical protein BGZ70_000530 [Mortierella alpina]